MIRKLALFAGLAAIAGGLAFWFLTTPRVLSSDALAALPDGDASRGELVFWAGGCASCHAADDAKDDEGRHLTLACYGMLPATRITDLLSQRGQQLSAA